jgi:lauroyl/myristoyl acyltransferase
MEYQMEKFNRIITRWAQWRYTAFSRITQWVGKALAIPPPLPTSYSMLDFSHFMRREIFHYSRLYARNRVKIVGSEHLLNALEKSPVVISFLHHGSWILIGGALVWQLSVPYTVIASRRNLIACSHEERDFWTSVHKQLPRFYRNPLFFTDEPPTHALRWLRAGGRALGVAIDVREIGQRHKEYPLRFSGHTLYMQTGAARLARLAGAAIIPSAILYDPERRQHTLHLLPAVAAATLNPIEATQSVLEAIEPYYLAAPDQMFHHLIPNFSQPHFG